MGIAHWVSACLEFAQPQVQPPVPKEISGKRQVSPGVVAHTHSQHCDRDRDCSKFTAKQGSIQRNLICSNNKNQELSSYSLGLWKRNVCWLMEITDTHSSRWNSSRGFSLKEREPVYT